MTEPPPAKTRLTEYFANTGALGNGGPLSIPDRDGPEWFRKNLDDYMDKHCSPQMKTLNFIDPTAQIMGGSVIWHFARVLANCIIGKDCSIGSGAEIGRGTTIGDRTRISSGVFLPSNSRIGNDVFIGPNVTCTDDRFPRTLKPGETYRAEPPTIEDHASIGAGAVLLPGVRIGKGARVAAGATVTKDVPDGLAVKGFAAKRFELSKEAQTAYLSDFAEIRTLGAQ